MSKAPAPPTGDFPPGTLLNARYRVVAVIGRGGLATVYRAHDESLGRTVALKVLSGGIGDGGDARRREDEVRLIAGFNHPSLVTLFDFTAIEGSPAVMLVMQLVEGTDLASRIRQGPLGSQPTAVIGADIAAALVHTHGRGVIHRDIKPANILLPANGDQTGGPSALLADFGIARLVDDASVTAAGIVIGTASYLSPEQATGQPLGPSTDIYSLGLVLLECLTGTRAFPGSPVESVTARLASDPAIPPAVGPAWSELLAGMLAREPGSRPDAAEVERRLRSMPASTLPAPTRVMPAAAVATERLVPPATTRRLASTRQLDEAASPTRPPVRTPRPSVLVAAALGAAIGTILLLVVILQLVSPATDARVTPTTASSAPSTPSASPVATPTSPAYPAVAGDLGDKLEALQQSVSSLESESTAEDLQQLVLDITEAAAAEDYESALELSESLRRQIDAAALTTTERDAIRHANDEVRRQLDHLVKGSAGPGGGPPGKKEGP